MDDAERLRFAKKRLLFSPDSTAYLLLRLTRALAHSQILSLTSPYRRSLSRASQPELSDVHAERSLRNPGMKRERTPAGKLPAGRGKEKGADGRGN
ncbi:hypothetical protein PUN28_000892 [Cardiocondyla obscurior]|uniref:Uncharacterized protein n=1 Tax=Cardiocondyla obscurior TaxID=286306 RepID=A0AAW2H1N4_9HYME